MGWRPGDRFESSGAWEGLTEFIYHADDGERPPEGGPSAPAIVSITVASGPQIVHRFDYCTQQVEASSEQPFDVS